MKRILSVFMVLLLLSTLLLAASAETVKLAYKSGSLNLRTGPGTKYANNGYVHNGDTITVLSKGSVWSKIRTSDSREGYIKNLYISGNGSGYASGTTYYSKHYTGTVKTKYAASKVNLRSGAGTGYAHIASLKNGQKLTVLGKNGSWFLVSTSGGTQGFVHSKYVKTSASSSSSSSKTAVVTASAVNMRSGPGTGYGKVATLAKNTKVTIVSTSNSKWWKVKYGSKTGFIWSKYLKK